MSLFSVREKLGKRGAGGSSRLGHRWRYPGPQAVGGGESGSKKKQSILLLEKASKNK